MSKKLSALDLAFLSLEKQTTPVNVASLMIMQCPPAASDTYARDLLLQLEDQPAGPPFNQKLSATNSAKLPSWVLDDNFDIHYHVRHSALPKPGTIDDLLELVSRIHSRVLDRERPLWEFYLIEGLEGNRFAVYMKMHHAAIDGMGGVELLENCLTLQPCGKVKAPWSGFATEKTNKTALSLKEKTLKTADKIGHQVKMVQDLSKILWGQGMKGMGLSDNASPVPFSAPKSMLNVPITGARRFAVKNLPLSVLKQIGQQAGATVNDMILALCAGALREYLKEKGQLPKKSLIASVPVSVRQVNRAGNQITYVIADLATNEPDSIKRLQKIGASTQDAKHEISDVSTDAATSFAVMAQGVVAALNQMNMTSWVPPVANVTISNVPGPRQPLYFGDARLTASYPMSVLIDGQSLNITVFSYGDTIGFGMLACRDVMPDVNKLADYIDIALDRIKGGIFLQGLMAQQQGEKGGTTED